MPRIKREKVEIKDCRTVKNDPKFKPTCICCGKKLEADKGSAANAEAYPIVYEGVVFRSSGQFGSKVLDCGVGIPSGWSPEVQIIVCDKCLLKKANTVNTRTNKRAVIERRAFSDVAVEWSDYSTFAELNKTRKKE